MTNKFLDLLGLSEFLNNLKSMFVTKSNLTSHTENSTVHITSSERTKWNSAKTHADSAHAPNNAERNAIVSIKKNGQALNPDSTRSVNIEVPDDYIISGEQTSTSSVDGGLNTFTFRTSKGESSTFNIKNGSKGSQGERGLTGAKGDKGTAGISITDVKQTTTSSVDSGNNVITVSLSDGTTKTFSVKNGSKGSTGIQGSKGDTGDVGPQGPKGDTGAKGATGTRGSIMNWGTAITGTSTTATVFSGSGISSSLVSDLYINTSNWNIYQCTASGSASVAKWVYKGNIKGATGAKGSTGATGAAGVSVTKVEQTTTSTSSGGTNVVTVTLSNGTTSTFSVKNGAKGSTGTKGDKGDTGAQGTRGSKWYNGTAITGTSTTATVFSGSGISNALIDDYYLNTSTSYVYKCTVSGSASAAKWVYIGSIRGIAGINATTTSVATSSKNGLMSSADFIKLSNMTNEILLESEPTNQQNGDYWIKEY